MRSPASRLGSPGANSHPSTRSVTPPRRTPGPPGLATRVPGGLDGPVAAGEAQSSAAGGRAVAGAARYVGLDPVDADGADVAAARPDRVRPGRADLRLPARAEALEALQHLDVAA